jgi:hypothetical protein
MKKVIFFFVSIISTTGHSQDFYELGLGFSSLRIWNIDAPVDPMQDLKFYYSPHLSFNYYFNDDKIVIGVAAGIAHETGNIDSEFNSIKQTREDLRNSLHYQVMGGVNVFRKKTSFLQLTAGARANRTYFFQHYSEEIYESGAAIISQYESKVWRGPRYSGLFSVGYHKSLGSDLRKESSIIVRASWDFVYHFPYEYGTSQGIKNKYGSFSTGPSFSVIWRIRGSKNSGLF